MRVVNLTIAFLLELSALAALAYWGVRTGDGPLTKSALGIGAPLAAAIVWGLFAAPKARFSNPAIRVVVKVVVFGCAAVALYSAGQRALAVAFTVAVVVNALMTHNGRL